MSSHRRETVPGTWEDTRDTTFFRITAALFPPDASLGATVLLASYDEEPVTAPPAPTSPAVGVRPRVVPQPVPDRAA
jgi:hypothetical protein